MTQCIKEDTTEIKLEDCLACSGCITEEESKIFSIDRDILYNRNNSDPLVIIIDTHVKISLYEKYRETHDIKWKYESFGRRLMGYLKEKYTPLRIIDTSCIQITEEKPTEEISIGSECPAAVLYVERVYPELVKYLKTNKSKLQQVIEFVQNQHKRNIIEDKNILTENKNLKILAITQCYDKKDEINREQYKNVHLVGGKDLWEAIDADKLLNSAIQTELENWERSYEIPKTPQNNSLEINGLENVLSSLRKLKRGMKGDIEPFVCKGGCKGGLALPKSIPSSFKLPQDAKNTFLFSGSDQIQKRTFKQSKKRHFDVQW